MLTNEQIKSLNELETEVFSYIVEHGKAILNMKINDLSKATHVSTTTILRFCKKAGCNGFSEFKIKYRLYLEQSKDAEYGSQLYSLLDFFHKIDKEEFEHHLKEVAEIIAKKKDIVLVGIGMSGAIAKYGASLCNSLQINCFYKDNPYYILPNIDYSDTAVICLSISGNTVETVEHAKKYKEKNAYVVSITNQDDCGLVKCSNDSFTYYINEEHYGQLNITTQIPAMFILESLVKKVKSFD